METTHGEKLEMFRKILHACCEIIMAQGTDIMPNSSAVWLSVHRMPDNSFDMNVHYTVPQRVPGEMDIVEDVKVFNDEKCTWRVNKEWFSMIRKGGTDNGT